MTLLLEKQNYKEMFSKFDGKINPDVEEGIDEVIEWARKVLKRVDRIHWFLKIYRTVISKNSNTNVYNDGHDYNIKRLMRELTHYMGIEDDYLPIKQYQFRNQPPESLLSDLGNLEQELIDKQTEDDRYVDEKGSKVIDCGDGWAWWNLGVSECPAEGAAMGHCGNQFGDSDDVVFSLRKKSKSKKVGYREYRPSLTFIINKGYLGEMKGRGNTKPNAKYHEYIVRLLMSKYVIGIGKRGHAPESDFHLNDLPESTREMIYKAKPKLLPPHEYYKRYGLDDHIRLVVTNELEHIGWGASAITKINGEDAIFLDSVENITDLIKRFELDRETDESLSCLLHGYDAHSTGEWLEQAPQAYIDKIMDVIDEEYKEEFNDERGGSDDEDDYIAFFNSIEDSASIAGSITIEEITTSSIYSAFINNFNNMENLVFEHSDGKYRLGVRLQKALESFETENGFEDAEEENWYETVSTSRPNYHEDFDIKIAIKKFIEHCDNKFLPDIPNMKDYKELSFSEITEELGKSMEEIKDSYKRYAYKNIELISYARSMVSRERIRKWGIDEN